MPRLIDADAFWKAMTTRFYSYADLDEISDVLDSMPTISPDDVRGVWKWIHMATTDICPFCKYETGKRGIMTKYCPNCGARLEVSEDA